MSPTETPSQLQVAILSTEACDALTMIHILGDLCWAAALVLEISKTPFWSSIWDTRRSLFKWSVKCLLNQFNRFGHLPDLPISKLYS